MEAKDNVNPTGTHRSYIQTLHPNIVFYNALNHLEVSVTGVLGTNPSDPEDRLCA